MIYRSFLDAAFAEACETIGATLPPANMNAAPVVVLKPRKRTFQITDAEAFARAGDWMERRYSE